MTNHSTKNILLGITGGIAAYKSAELTRLLIKAGFQVRICMTEAATQFVSPLTFQALSGHPVHTDLLDTEAEAAMGHIELARWADYVLIAPVTANTLATLAHGFANDLLSTVCLATTSPIVLAPAMNQYMWSNKATQANIRQLHDRGMHFIDPERGQQACGEVGVGRMAEPKSILEYIQVMGQTSRVFENTRILMTAGGTREAIDPVRFIGNRSSGKMGYAIARVACEMGAEVTLVSGVTSLEVPNGVTRIVTESAKQMYDVVMQHAPLSDLFIAVAAVADYSPVETHSSKIKKSADQLNIVLKRNPDILKEVSIQFPQVFSVGFAAETDNVLAYARGKLKEKKLDMIAANQVGQDQAFDQSDNALDVLWQDGRQSLPKMDKNQLAVELLKLVYRQYRASPKSDQ